MEKIKQLREKTGAGMVDCKKALDESNGDIEKAIEILRKKGISKAAKRVGRETSEGIIKVIANEECNEGYIVEVNAETDFVARNEQFQEFANKVVEVAKGNKIDNVEKLLETEMENGTVKENLDNLSGVIGEKLEIKRCEAIITEGTVGAYSHMGGKIGVLVELNKTGEKELANDIAMHVAAANPKYLKPEDVNEDELNKEKEIYKEQLIKEGKPENIIEKIIEGKISKYYEEECLIKQEYVKDDKKKIEEILGDVKINSYIRFSL